MAPRGGYRPKAEVLEAYKQKVEGWKAAGIEAPDLRKFTAQELLLLDAKLHPTKRRESIELTVRLIRYLLTVQVATTEEMRAALQCHDVPVRRRINVMRSLGMVRRESRIYHVATPRLVDFVMNYLGSVVTW